MPLLLQFARATYELVHEYWPESDIIRRRIALTTCNLWYFSYLAPSIAITEKWPLPCSYQKSKQFIRRSRRNMKKLLALLFTFALAFTMVMPVFAQDTGQEATTTTTKAKKTKKTKKAKKTTAATTAPAQ